MPDAFVDCRPGAESVLSTNAVSQTSSPVTLPFAVGQRRWWMVPHLLSLDAPAVTVCWQFAFAWTLGVAVPWPEVVVLFLSVWLAYSADRVFDTWRVQKPLCTPRHRFSNTYRSQILLSWPAVLAIDLAIALNWLSPEVLRNGFPLGACVLLYIAMAQLVPRFGGFLLAKEFSVGAIIASGALWASLGQGRGPKAVALLIATGTIACAWNCVAISLWESPSPSKTRSLRLEILSRLNRNLHPWTILLALICIALGAAIGSAHGLALGFAFAGSLLLLEALHRWRNPQNADLRRVLSDVALLLPGLLLLLPQ